MNDWFERIRRATTLAQLDAIVEAAAYQIEKDSDYCKVYDAALTRAQTW